MDTTFDKVKVALGMPELEEKADEPEGAVPVSVWTMVVKFSVNGRVDTVNWGLDGDSVAVTVDVVLVHDADLLHVSAEDDPISPESVRDVCPVPVGRIEKDEVLPTEPFVWIVEMTVETTVLLPSCDVNALPGTDVTDAATDEFNESDVVGKIVVTLD